MQVPDNADFNNSRNGESSGDFTLLEDGAKITYTIHKAEIRTKNLKGTQRKSLSLGLICCDMETGAKNYLWDELYIDSEVWLDKDKNGNPWMVNFYLAMSNSCGLRPQGSRELPDSWFSDARYYQNKTGEAVISKTEWNGEYRNEIRYYVQREKQTGGTIETYVPEPVVTGGQSSGGTQTTPEGIDDIPFIPCL